MNFCTQHFQSTTFPALNRKKFVTFIRKSKGSSYDNQEKLQDLLNRLGLQSRAFSHGGDVLSDKLLSDIDYDKVFEVIEKEQDRLRLACKAI